VGNITSRQQALKVIVSLSSPSKMPCWGYSISAKRCVTGRTLQTLPGSTCSECYATKGFYGARLAVQRILEDRRRALDDPDWIDAMVYLIWYYRMAYFRWHDSGDLQGVWHLAMICQVAVLTPNCKHWLPTLEWGMIRKYKEGGGKIPENLCIRLSTIMIGGNPPQGLAKRLGVQVSSVTNALATCPASTKSFEVKPGKFAKGYCGACRNCWNKDKFEIVYKYHGKKNNGKGFTKKTKFMRDLWSDNTKNGI